MRNRRLQLQAFGVVCCLLISNSLHLLIPRQTGIIIDSFDGDTTSTRLWTAVLVFAFLKLLASESGVDLARQWLWVPVSSYAAEAMTTEAYSRIMHLSADFHDSKNTSDMQVAMHSGQEISGAVETILLQAIPMLVDMGLAVTYLSVTFGSYQGLVTITTGVAFLLLVKGQVEKSEAHSRPLLSATFREYSLRHSGLAGWPTVAAFNQIGYEDNRHANAVANRWLLDRRHRRWWILCAAFQGFVLTSGLLLSIILAVVRIRSGRSTPGDFTMLLMYWAQLTSPLEFFSTFGRSLSQQFINAEPLLEIMKATPSVVSKKGARPLKFVAGAIEFSDVVFSYDNQKKIIQDFSIVVPAGQTVALVGSTGAGKSTLLKLLNRFYDINGGFIRIDGQDIRDVELYRYGLGSCHV